MAEVRAVAKFIRVQPRKVRIVANEVRGKSAQAMADVLRFHPSKGAFHLRKVIVSAIANAVENAGADPRTLVISKVQIDDGPKLKRITARSMGRANRIEKKMAHITVIVSEAEAAPEATAPKAKVKARPTLSRVGGKKKGKTAAAPVEAKAEEKVEAVEKVEAPAEEQPQAEEEQS